MAAALNRRSPSGYHGRSSWPEGNGQTCRSVEARLRFSLRACSSCDTPRIADATLRMAGEHGLTGQLLKAEEESVGDETSLCSFENARREADTTTFAVFYMKHGLLVGIELRGCLKSLKPMRDG